MRFGKKEITRSFVIVRLVPIYVALITSVQCVSAPLFPTLPEPVANGSFDESIDGWIVLSGEATVTDRQVEPPKQYALMSVGKALRLGAEPESPENQASIYQDILVLPARRYILWFLSKSGTQSQSEGRVLVGTPDDEDAFLDSGPLNAYNWTYRELPFTPDQSRIRITLRYDGEAGGLCAYFDELVVVEAPEMIVNGGLAEGTHGWSPCDGASLRPGCGIGDESCLEVTASSNGTCALQTVATRVGEFYTIEMRVKNGSARPRIVIASADQREFRYADETIDAVAWKSLRFNFQAETPATRIALYADAPGGALFHGVTLWHGRDDLMEQLGYRALAIHHWLVSTQSLATVTDRYDEGMTAYAHPTRALIALLLGEVWYSYTEGHDLSTARELLQRLLDHNSDLGTLAQLWGDSDEVSFMLPNLEFIAHWIWGELDDSSNPKRSALFDVITAELNAYTHGVVHDLKHAPDSVDHSVWLHSPGGTAAAHAWAWDLDYENTRLQRDTRAEDATGWATSLAYASRLFTASSGNGHWPGRTTAELDARDIWSVALADNETLITHDGYRMDRLSNVITGTMMLANHDFYPHPTYASVIALESTLSVWAYRVFGENVPTEYTDGLSARMSSPFYQQNLDGATILPDSGLDTSFVNCTHPTTECTFDDLPGSEMNSHWHKLAFLPAWWYLYDDASAYFEALRVVYMLQDNPDFWPSSLPLVNDETYENTWTNEDRHQWFGMIRASAEKYSQLAARYHVMRAFSRGELPHGNQFVDHPLTW